jgi:hypothetical protein
MNAFLKDNFAIVAAIVLPLILALLFALSTLVTRVTVDDPKYDLLIADEYYSGNSTFALNVVNDRLIISYAPPQKDANGNYMYGTKPRLWRVRVPDMKVEQVSLQEPTDKVARDIQIPGITDVPVSATQPGPDGYNFTNSYSYGNSLMSEIFDMDRGQRYRVAIYKDGRTVPIRIGDGHTYYNMHFIGWITEDKK